MPSLTPNFILRGARLATSTVSLPTRSARARRPTVMPENTLRVRPSPASSVRRSSLSQPSTCSAGDDLRDAQVDLGEVVDRDGRRRSPRRRAARFAGVAAARGRRLEQRVELLGVDALHQVLVVADAHARRAARVASREVSGSTPRNARRPAARERRQHRRQSRPSAAGRPRCSAMQTSCSAARPRRSCLASSQGLCGVDVLVDAVGERHDLAQRLAELARRRRARAIAPRRRAQRVEQRAAVVAGIGRSWPPKRLSMKPAARLAMLTYLPTRSLLTRATKSSGLKSMSSTLRVQLGRDVVAQPLGVHAELEVAQRRRCRCRGSCSSSRR